MPDAYGLARIAKCGGTTVEAMIEFQGRQWSGVIAAAPLIHSTINPGDSVLVALQKVRLVALPGKGLKDAGQAL